SDDADPVASEVDRRRRLPVRAPASSATLRVDAWRDRQQDSADSAPAYPGTDHHLFTRGGAPPPPRTYADASARIRFSSPRLDRTRSLPDLPDPPDLPGPRELILGSANPLLFRRT